MQRLSCGVAICTFNGKKYLPQQLESILSQSKVPDKIAISDDCSSDGTWEYLNSWAKEVDIPVILIRNKIQLGISRNFEQAATSLDTDLIFACDQDDIWLANKVELMTKLFESSGELLLAHSDAILVDANGANLGKTLFRELELSEHERNGIRSGAAFKILCRRNVVTGATAVFRRSLLALARPLPSESWVHDAWLAIIAACMGKIHLLDIPTIKYRQHGSNLIGVKKLGMAGKLRRTWWDINGSRPLKFTTDRIFRARIALQNQLRRHPNVPIQYLTLAEEASDFAKYRGTLPMCTLRRFGLVLLHAAKGKYNKFSDRPWTDMLRDVLNR